MRLFHHLGDAAALVSILLAAFMQRPALVMVIGIAAALWFGLALATRGRLPCNWLRYFHRPL